jgi:NAD(P)-dependent dehydrogenase (short-subunit alcohol dehydrogenase family)
MRRFDGMVAVVFGAARPPGIGAALARRLAGEGAAVACVDHVVDPLPDEGDTFAVTAEALSAIADELRDGGARSVAVPADLLDGASITAAIATASSALGEVRLGANLSGGTGPGAGNGRLLDLDDDAWHRALAINLTSAWRISRSLARAMLEHGQGGAIVNLSSHVTRSAAVGFGAFAAAKAGVQMLTKTLSYELAPHGIRVNAVAPLGVAGPQPNPGLAATLRDPGSIPLGRFQSPDEVAAVAAHLLCADASFVTGETVYVSGGA